MPRLVEYVKQPELIRTGNLTGAIKYEYDAIGNRTGEQILGEGKVVYQYDDLNRLDTVLYPAGSNTANIDYGYDGLKNLKWVDNGNTRWDYLYNKEDIIEEEKLTVGGQSYGLNYTYNSVGSLKTVTYPKGWTGTRRTVDYSPNALGQPTAVDTYISQIQYYPTGLMSQASLANGQVFSATQNARGLPEAITTSGGSKTVSLSYTYDARGNIGSIQEQIGSSVNNRTMGYDGVSRLTSASGYWGTGSFSYDDWGNITSKNLGSETDTFNYDTNNNLTSVTGAHARTYAYDNRGNAISDGLHDFVFDYLNLASTGNTEFFYDGHNRRAITFKDSKETAVSLYIPTKTCSFQSLSPL